MKLAPTILVFGDPERVKKVSTHFPNPSNKWQ